MPTTIQISNDVKSTLEKMKIFDRESYNEVMERMIEDYLELNERTKEEIEEAKKRIQSGKFVSMQDIEKEFDV